GISPLVFIVGLRFDASVIAYALSVFIVLSVLPFHLEEYKTFRRIQSFFFFIPLAVCVFMNLADMEYYRFIFRRTTIDIVRFFSFFFFCVCFVFYFVFRCRYFFFFYFYFFGSCLCFFLVFRWRKKGLGASTRLSHL